MTLSHNWTSSTNATDIKTHATKGELGNIQSDRDHTHSSGETYHTHPSQCPALKAKLAHTHAHTLGVFSLMAERSESEELTSPANTVHPVCMRARQRAAVRTADVLLHITNMIYNHRIRVSIPTMRSAWIKNRFEAE